MKKLLIFSAFGILAAGGVYYFLKMKKETTLSSAIDQTVRDIAEKGLFAYLKGDKFRTMKYPLNGKTYEVGFVDFGEPQLGWDAQLSAEKTLKRLFKEQGEEALLAYLKTLECIDESSEEDKKEHMMKISFKGALPSQPATPPLLIASVTLEPDFSESLK